MADRLSVDRSTLSDWRTRLEATSSTGPAASLGRARLIGPADAAALQAQVDAHPDATLAENAVRWAQAKDHSHDDAQASDEFHDLVNLTPSALQQWLDADESKAVGQKKDGKGESTGHHMGHEIVELLHTNKADYTDDDFERMRKVTAYIRRHTAQQPDGGVTDTPWRYSLMNMEHDPLKK